MVAKSVTPSRIQSNFDIWDFQLSPADMRHFDDLNVGWRHLIWAETSAHPDYPFKDDLPRNLALPKPGVGSTLGAKE